jgi:hypothetical protein
MVYTTSQQPQGGGGGCAPPDGGGAEPAGLPGRRRLPAPHFLLVGPRPSHSGDGGPGAEERGGGGGGAAGAGRPHRYTPGESPANCCHAGHFKLYRLTGRYSKELYSDRSVAGFAAFCTSYSL